MQTEWIIDQNTQEVYVIKIIVISMMTYLVNIKLMNIKGKNFLNIVLIISICVISGIIREVFDLLISLWFLVCALSCAFSISTKSGFGYALLINTISLSINHILFFLAIIISYLPFGILKINNEIANLLLILLLYILIVYRFFKIKKIKNGLIFLNKNKNNEYFNLIILNISVIIMFFVIVISNYKKEITGKIGIGLIVSAIIMIVTIQKSLQLYYKQKMLIKDLEETKAELENKRKEVEELEKENLNFSKVSHSIAHKQKSLEFKLNELSMKSEISSEINLKDRVDKLGKALTKETISVIDKTGIEEIDDMLKYMQAECIKNKIDFQLQLSGNIYTMINHYIDKEELEILLADHIKNAIIAISYTDNLNKSILVRLGKLDGYYGLYIYDSGIEFEEKTLYKLGKIPATTHKDNGGTGMGFMNTFDTLRKHKASFVIEEYGKPVKNNFTKALKFIFNEKNEFKIYSYRWEKIRRENKEDNFVVEKLNI